MDSHADYIKHDICSVGLVQTKIPIGSDIVYFCYNQVKKVCDFTCITLNT